MRTAGITEPVVRGASRSCPPSGSRATTVCAVAVTIPPRSADFQRISRTVSLTRRRDAMSHTAPTITVLWTRYVSNHPAMESVSRTTARRSGSIVAARSLSRLEHDHTVARHSGLRIGDHALHAIEVAGRHVTRAQQVRHERFGSPVEEQRGELRDHRATHFLLGDEGTIDELTAVEPVFHDATLLESREQRGDRRLREVALRPKAGLD